MLVVDRQLFRFSKLSPAYRFVASTPLPVAMRQWIPIRGGQVVINADIRTRALAGWPIHILNADGTVAQSFGATQPELDPTNRYKTWRTLAIGRTGDIWAARVNEYVIERWTTDGRLLTVVRRNAAWFKPWTNYEGPESVVRPPDYLRAIWEDSAGLLWVAISVPDAQWKRTNFKAREGDMIPMPRADNDSYYDTIVEVLDVSSGELIATQRFPHSMHTVGNGQPFVTYHEEASGNPLYRVWHFNLNQGR
ncbi:MAG: hypothetical protein ACRERX_23370 [Pseudomonas sp.]